MTLQQLKYAMVVARTGSMNKAAESLYISQPTLTNTIRGLEEETGITLFNRTNKGVNLTSEGSDFIFYAKKVCDQYEQLIWRYDGKGNTRKVFSVSTQHYAFVCEAFAEVVKAYDASTFHFSILETTTPKTIEDVSSQISEVGVLFLSDFNRVELNRIFVDNGLTYKKIVSCRFYVYLGKNHPLADRTMIDYEDIIKYPLITYEQGKNSPLYMSEEIFAEQDYPYSVKVSDRASMLQIMKKLNGFTFCSGAVKGAVGWSDYKVIPLRESAHLPYSSMEIGYIHKDELSEIGKKFIDELYKAAPAEEHQPEGPDSPEADTSNPDRPEADASNPDK
ncbi:MAG: LysR family transcriptional regulator [Lachnospiraceae bacterium]|nr:LysR family transcriptional regulator [Lachnospiraceae bacterium]